MSSDAEFVFGYGALVALQGKPLTRAIDPRGFVADLIGYRRLWGVAMDNRVDLPSYKHYLNQNGERPEVFVSFLDVRRQRDSSVNGVCQPVDAESLAELDMRERNYRRVDVSAHVQAGGARVWTYVGTPAGRERLRAGRRAGRAVIDAVYLATVDAAFAELGEIEHQRCRPSLEPRELPVVELRRVDD